MAPAILESLLGRNGRAVCRICQSETGIMIRPCACAGTMADIHENCLNEWVSISKAEKCEICKESYAQAERFRPIHEWEKPKITFRVSLFYFQQRK
uniref:RING-CH-type domain-containing protein n=1 Tax=Panagrolaimus davidi TaxID=227884 RepID=A0A914PRB4_9BILA